MDRININASGIRGNMPWETPLPYGKPVNPFDKTEDKIDKLFGELKRTTDIIDNIGNSLSNIFSKW